MKLSQCLGTFLYHGVRLPPALGINIDLVLILWDVVAEEHHRWPPPPDLSAFFSFLWPFQCAPSARNRKYFHSFGSLLRKYGCRPQAKSSIIDELLQAPADQELYWRLPSTPTNTTATTLTLISCFSAPCCQIWASEDTFWWYLILGIWIWGLCKWILCGNTH